MQALRVIWRVLTAAQRRRFVVLQMVALLMALSTVLGLAAVMAFLAVLADPSLIGRHALLEALARALALPPVDFLRRLSAAFIGVLVLAAAINIAGTRAMGRFACAVGDRIREVLFAGYLRRDYAFHARAGAGRLLDTVLNQADRVAISLGSAQQFVTNALLTVLVVMSIALVNPLVAIIGVLSVAGSYLLVYRLVRPGLLRHGRAQAQLGAQRVAVVEQAFRGIKYLAIARAQDHFGRRLSVVTRSLSRSFADTQFIGQFPRFVLECMAGAALIGCAAFVGGGIASGAWLAQLSFIGFAGFRLLPAVQQMYQAMVIVRHNLPAIVNVAAQLQEESAAPAQRALVEPLPLHHGIDLIDLSFRYDGDSPWVLENACLHIPAGAAIGIVGASGAGKTTLIDLMLGLLRPAAGQVCIDGQRLDARLAPSWQRAIGYVPQEVIILDAPVRENIAFGVDVPLIDEARLRVVAREAGAADFIEALPGGYDAMLSGVSGALSGGQRQRIGIARALYHDPGLLVLDEATNSLDADTERAIIDTVVHQRDSRTLLVVAHGAALIGACDAVFELRDGALRPGSAPTGRRAASLRQGVE